MPEAALSLGSNIGDSVATLRGAVADIAALPNVDVVAVSPVYETDPVGGPEQDPYLNAVAIVSTSLPAHALLAATQGIELAWHRERSVRWGPRTLDIDILAFGDDVIASDDLTVPHPRAHERAFVLVPWIDVRPDAVIPGHGPVADLLLEVGATGVRRTDHVIEAMSADGRSRS